MVTEEDIKTAIDRVAELYQLLSDELSLIAPEETGYDRDEAERFSKMFAYKKRLIEHFDKYDISSIKFVLNSFLSHYHRDFDCQYQSPRRSNVVSIIRELDDVCGLLYKYKKELE
ncbi:MAG: hypothetical protein J6T60_04915 [Bacteroidales bacterium]|nr:hypothetical protein [Bacteroidales bacterium]